MLDKLEKNSDHMNTSTLSQAMSSVLGKKIKALLLELFQVKNISFLTSKDRMSPRIFPISLLFRMLWGVYKKRCRKMDYRCLNIRLEEKVCGKKFNRTQCLYTFLHKLYCTHIEFVLRIYFRRCSVYVPSVPVTYTTKS